MFTFFITIIAYAAIVALMFTGWMSYQASVPYGVPLHWMARGRWVWTTLTTLIAFVGLFTILARVQGFKCVPEKTVLSKAIDWPDPNQMKTVSTDWHAPTTLIVWQDRELYHIGFAPRWKDYGWRYQPVDSCISNK